MEIRRVITAEDEAGLSHFLAVEPVAPVSGHVDWFPVWGWDSLPTLPVTEAGRESTVSVFPGPNGTRIAISVMHPVTDGRDATEEFAAMLAAVPAGGRSGWASGFHDTATIDVVFVISGTVTLELSGGDSTELSAGDVLVQNGTVHKWRNLGTVPCVLGLVLVAAENS
jgi:quercetin dioxygenase-like cupin family protein